VHFRGEDTTGAIWTGLSMSSMIYGNGRGERESCQERSSPDSEKARAAEMEGVVRMWLEGMRGKAQDSRGEPLSSSRGCQTGEEKKGEMTCLKEFRGEVNPKWETTEGGEFFFTRCSRLGKPRLQTGYLAKEATTACWG